MALGVTSFELEGIVKSFGTPPDIVREFPDRLSGLKKIRI
jgi:hypothetical protein